MHTYFNVMIQPIRFKTKNAKCTERRKISFAKETVENADLHKAVLNKTRNATRCNNRDDLLHLSFNLKILIFLEAYI